MSCILSFNAGKGRANLRPRSRSASRLGLELGLGVSNQLAAGNIRPGSALREARVPITKSGHCQECYRHQEVLLQKES